MIGPRVIGLDLSLTATGIADFRGREVTTKTIRSAPNGQTLRDQRIRLRRIVLEIEEVVSHQGEPPRLIVVEGPSYGSKGAGTWDRAGLWWLVVDFIISRRALPLAVIPPAVLKKFATGRGNADKTAMAVALQKRWGLELRDDNKVDAWWLGAAGREHLGVPYVEMPKAQREALAKVDWPEVA